MKQTTVPRRKTLMIIMDGFGVNPSKKNNAVHEANTPKLDEYFGKYPHTTLQASGRAVGLPDGQMGNSVVGHLTIGCGSIVKQSLVRIDDAVEDGSFAANPIVQKAIKTAKEMNRPIHITGLVSDGGVHSHITHLIALIKICDEMGATPAIHVIGDGRDTAPQVLKQFMQPLLDTINEYGGYIATIAGRFYAMDRDKRWERTESAFNAMVHGVGIKATDPMQAIDNAYANDESDEFIKPVVMEGADLIQENDPVIFFNFRNDRPRQLSAALAIKDFNEFDRGNFKSVQLTTLTKFDDHLPADIVFEPLNPTTNLAKILSEAGLTQLHCAETEKYAHVTFFMNGGREEPYENEERIMVNSPDVRTYDEKPEMSATEVADNIISSIQQGKHDFIVVNFANGDMVGHTAVKDAVLKAVETLDREVGRVLDSAVENDYSVIVTADHGNCDEYIDPLTGAPNPQHTVYPVPCLIIDKSFWRLSTGGGLSNLAPTILQLMDIQQPEDMTGKSLLLEELTDVEAPEAY